MIPFRILAAGAVHSEGLFSTARGHLPLAGGVAALQRRDVLDRPYVGFGKLQLADKLAFGAAALALEESDPGIAASTGICCAAPFGSLMVDIAYAASMTEGFPSPALFSATLPSSAITDIAIYFGLKGPDRVLCHQTGCGQDALTFAVTALALKKARRMLVVYCGGIHDSGQVPATLTATRDRPLWALALYLEGARVDAPNTGERYILAPRQSSARTDTRDEELYLYTFMRYCTGSGQRPAQGFMQQYSQEER